MVTEMKVIWQICQCLLKGTEENDVVMGGVGDRTVSICWKELWADFYNLVSEEVCKFIRHI